MQIPFSELPGRHERHYRRRLDNDLFDQPAVASDEVLSQAQRLDHEELIAFIDELREVVGQAVSLKPREETETVLGIKEALERLYETSAGLADDQSGNQQAIRELLAVIMRTVRSNAEGDALAAQELGMEEQARVLHFDLLKEPLIADLLHPESLIGSDDLVPTLLSETESALSAALSLFDPEQRKELAGHARALLESRDPERRHAAAWQRLELLSQINP